MEDFDKSKFISPKYVLRVGLIASVAIPSGVAIYRHFDPPTDNNLHSYLNLYLAFVLGAITTAASIITYNLQSFQKQQSDLLKSLQEEEIKSIKRSIKEISLAFPNINNVKVYSVTREDFYSQLSDNVHNSKKRVLLTYLAKKPPESEKYTQYDSKRKYMSDLAKTIRSNQKHIKRIILLTEENKEWIKGLVDKYNGKSNFSLAVLKDDNLIPRVPFQIFDNNKIILIGKIQAESSDKRDIIIESEDMMKTYEIYYDELWKSKSCIQLIENGKKDESNCNLIIDSSSNNHVA